MSRVTINKKAALRWKPFDRSMWMGFAGAEEFPNGDEPIYAEEGNFIAIADANGFQVMDDTLVDIFSFDIGLRDAEHAESISTRLIRTPISVENLVRAGFKPI